jgi:diguanylate cyclase (GGDEF)-like protein
LKCEYTDAFLHRFPLTYACTYFVGLLIETVRAKTNEALVTSRTMYAHLSRTDELTGLHNRMGLQAKLNELFAADAIDFSIAFVIMDLDDFKSVNDSHGHIDGDALLVHHAQILSELVPADGYLARWGGEEFVILLCRPEGKLQVKALIDSIQKRFKEIYRGLSVSASFGVSFLKPGMTQEDLTRQADAALYEAKAAGKACCRFAE